MLPRRRERLTIRCSLGATNLDVVRPPLPPPAHLDALPRALLAELAKHVGEVSAAEQCADLLAGADPHDFADVLPYLGGRPALAVLEGGLKRGWARVWGARGLLYVWCDTAASAVVEGLADRSWRVAEHCLKVSTLRELGAAGPGATVLTSHRLARLRAQAVRTLGVVGDTEHVAVVRAKLDDPDETVRRAASKALRGLSERLDLPG